MRGVELEPLHGQRRTASPSWRACGNRASPRPPPRRGARCSRCGLVRPPRTTRAYRLEPSGPRRRRRGSCCGRRSRRRSRPRGRRPLLQQRGVEDRPLRPAAWVSRRIASGSQIAANSLSAGVVQAGELPPEPLVVVHDQGRDVGIRHAVHTRTHGRDESRQRRRRQAATGRGGLSGRRAGPRAWSAWPPGSASRCSSRAGRYRQDPAGQVGGRDGRRPTRPAAVLRGHRRVQGAVRVGLPQAAAVDPGRPGGERSPDAIVEDGAGIFDERFLLPRPMLGGDSQRAAGRPARRRGGPRRRRDRGAVPRGAGRAPGVGARTGPARGAAYPAGVPHLERHPGPVRGAQAAVPVPLPGLPERRARARDRAQHVPELSEALAERAGRAGRNAAPAEAEEAAVGVGDDRLRADAEPARQAELDLATATDWAQHPAQVPGRHPGAAIAGAAAPAAR